ncbi:MFS transporter [Chloroflexota bacterium]
MAEITGNGGIAAKTARFGSFDYIKITIFGFALSALWQGMHNTILPLRLLDFVTEAQKNTYLGLITFSGLILAMLIQPIAGAISDRSGFKWGQRRPYILMGTLLLILLLPGVSLVGSYAAILVIYCLMQFGSNVAQGPYQAFIPDLVPEGRRGLASGVKSLLEILGGISLLYPIAIFMDRYAAGDGVSWLWLAWGIPAVILFGVTLFTLFSVKERPGTGRFTLASLPSLYKSFRIDVRENRDFIWFLVSRLLIFMAFTTLQTFVLYFLRDVVGVANPATDTATFSIIMVASALVVAYPAGRLSDRIGRRPIVIASGLLGALWMVFIFIFQHNYPLVMLFGSLVGVSFGAFMSTNWALATDLIARGEEARYLGLANMANAGGAALARLIGPVIDFFNASSPGMGYSVMLLACFLYFVAGSLLLFKVKRRV